MKGKMDMNEVIKYLFCLIESILLFLVIANLFEFRYDKLYKKLILVLIVIGHSLFAYWYTPFSLVAKNTLFIAVTSFTLVVFFEGYLSAKLFFSFLISYEFLISDVLVANIVAVLTGKTISQFINAFGMGPFSVYSFSLICKVVNVILVTFTIYYFKKIDFFLKRRYWIVLDIIMFLFLVISQGFMNINAQLQEVQVSHVDLTIAWFSFFAISVLVLYFFREICQYQQNERLNYIVHIQNQALEKQLNMQEASNKEMRKLKHDIQNHFRNISYMAESQQYQEILNYIKELVNNLEQVEKTVQCGNYAIDAVVNTKLSYCKEHGITFSYEIAQVENIALKEIEIASVLANVLDNAIEAVAEVKEENRTIKLQIYRYKNYIVIKVENRHVNHFLYKKGKLITSKENKREHGYGLKIIQSTVEKCGGSFQYNIDEQTFYTTILFPSEG